MVVKCAEPADLGNKLTVNNTNPLYVKLWRCISLNTLAKGGKLNGGENNEIKGLQFTEKVITQSSVNKKDKCGKEIMFGSINKINLMFFKTLGKNK